MTNNSSMNRLSLELRQSQTLVMTQQLQQSIKLLQLSSTELVDFVAAEMEKNPLLSGGDNEDEEAIGSTHDGKEPERSNDDWESEEAFDAPSSEDFLDTSEESWWGEESSSRYDGAVDGRTIEHDGDYYSPSDALDQRYSSEESLREHVLAQIPLEITNPIEQRIAIYLADMLDDAGYLRENVRQIADQLGIKESELEAVLAKLQRLDPVGVFARSLEECLRIQLEDIGELTDAFKLLLPNLQLIGDGNLKGAAKAAHVSEEELAEMLDVIRSLNPRPGASFSHERVETMIPDVLLKRLPAGAWQVELNQDALPKLILNRRYLAELSGQSTKRDEKKFLNEQLGHANWLIKALDQRANTMLAVASEIVRQQEDFFLHGIHHLKPLTLKDVAANVKYHESTISRVTTNKFMVTPRGVFELKYFFSSSISSLNGGDQVSSRAVMHRIKEMVETEAGDKVLSDDDIAIALKEKGMDIARRTVVKYRKAMNIPSSVERRRSKRKTA